MRILKLALFVALFALFISNVTYANSVVSPFRTDIRALGMGGAYVAVGDNQNAFIYNPALLSESSKELSFSFLELRFDVNSTFFDVLDFIQDHQEDFDDFEDLSAEQKIKFYNDIGTFDDQWANTYFSPAFNLNIRNVGFAIYNTTDLDVKVDRGIYEPRVYGEAISDIVVTAGYARQLSPKFSLGGAVKYINRRKSDLVKINASDMGSNQDILTPAVDKLQKGKGGLGLDVGSLYDLTPNLTLAGVLQDLYTKIGDEKPPVNLKLGVGYHFNYGIVQDIPLVNEIVFAFDVQDGFNQRGNNFFNKVHLGADFKTPHVDFRLGANQGYFTGGVGIDFRVVRLDYAYYGEELGTLPEQDARWNHALQLKLGW